MKQLLILVFISISIVGCGDAASAVKAKEPDPTPTPVVTPTPPSFPKHDPDILGAWRNGSDPLNGYPIVLTISDEAINYFGAILDWVTTKDQSVKTISFMTNGVEVDHCRYDISTVGGLNNPVRVWITLDCAMSGHKEYYRSF